MFVKNTQGLLCLLGWLVGRPPRGGIQCVPFVLVMPLVAYGAVEILPKNQLTQVEGRLLAR